MAYGILKCDQITFTNGGIDQTVTVSGIVQSISGNITATGTIQAATIIGTSTVSGATVTGNVGVFTSITGGTAGFTTVTGTTVTGTSSNFVSGVFSTQVSGTTVRGTTVSGATVTGNAGQFTTITGTSAGFTTITGATVTGTTANFATLSGTTITGNTVTVASGTYTGNVTAAAFIPTSSGVPANGLYLPAANSVALATNGTGRLTVDSTGNVVIPGKVIFGALNNIGGAFDITRTSAGVFSGFRLLDGGTNPYLQTGAEAGLIYLNADGSSVPAIAVRTGTTERLRITSDGKLGLGISSPGAILHTANAESGLFGANISGNVYIESTTPAAANVGGGITFGGAFSGTTTTIGAGIKAAKTNGTAGDYGFDLSFYTRANGTAGAERMRLDSSGRLGVGTTSPGESLHVVGSIRASGSIFSTDGTRYALLGTDGSNPYLGTAGLAQAFVLKVGNGSTDVERARLTTSGQLLVGTSTSLPQNSQLQVVSAVAQAATLQYSANNGSGAYLNVRKSRGTAGSPTEVNNNDLLGGIVFQGYDGAAYQDGAYLFAEADGTWTDGGDASDNPARLVFYTTADGASSPTERLRITSAGVLQVADAGNIAVGTTTGTKIGTATTQKLGFYNATPVVQPAAVADATDAASVITQLNDLLSKLRTLGIIAT